ncbi:MAG: hypothetical protein QW379_04810 [Thermoplasmata archaeon]
MRWPNAGILAVAAGLLLSAIAASAFSPAATRCGSCHSGGSPAGGYVLTPPGVEIECPPVWPPGSHFTVNLTVSHAGGYELRGAKAAVSLSGPGGLGTGEFPQLSLGGLNDTGGRLRASWRVDTGNETGVLMVNVTFLCRLHYTHIDVGSGDEGLWAVVEPRAVSVRPVSLVASCGELKLEAGSKALRELRLRALSPVTELKVTLPPGLERVVDIEFSPGALDAGEEAVLGARALRGGGTMGNGLLTLSWKNATGSPDAMGIAVRVVPPPSGPGGSGSPLRLAGRATGILSLLLLIASLALGFVRRGGRVRVRLHCAISLFLLALAVYHGALLVLGPYSSVSWNFYILLGWASAIWMGVASVNGLLRRWMTRILGAGGWRWIHRIATLVALVMVIIHAISIGTDFRFLRGLMGHEGGSGWRGGG